MIDKLSAKGLAGATVRACTASASGAFRHGVRDLGALPRNPVRDLDGDLPSGARTSEPRYLSVSEVDRLLLHLGQEFRPVAASMFWGALRVSEALSLRWADIDFEGKRISVAGTKTKASAATIPLLPALAEELRAHREWQGRQGFQRITQEALVFQTLTGLSPGRRNVLRAVSNAGRRAGLVPEGAEEIGCHDLRHSFAAFALGGGLSMVKTAKVLRHANPQVTATVYAGLTNEAVDALGDELAAIGGGS